MSPTRAWNPMSISIPSSPGEGPMISYKLMRDWNPSLKRGSGNVLRHPGNVRGRSVKTTSPANSTLCTVAMLLLTGTILTGGELNKGCPVSTLGPGAQGIKKKKKKPNPKPKKNQIQNCSETYSVACVPVCYSAAASLPCSHGFLHCIN